MNHRLHALWMGYSLHSQLDLPPGQPSAGRLKSKLVKGGVYAKER
jgi:hypothetical protein